MAQETAAGHLPRHHKDIGKAIRNGLIAATMLGGIAAGAVAVKNVIEKDSPSYHIITSERFGTPPPRGLAKDTPNNTGELPTIKEYRNSYFTPGIPFVLEERPPIERTRPDGSKIDTVSTFPYISIAGYLIQKELNPDGSVMLAIEIPGKDGLFTQDDIDKAPISLEQVHINQIPDDGNRGKLTGAIVWLELKSADGLTLPFTFSSAWYKDEDGFDGFGARRSGRMTTIPEEMFRYAQIGDAMSAIAGNAIDSFTQQKLAENYLNQQGPLPYDEAQKRYQELVDHNASMLQKMLDDAQAGKNVTLRQQLEEKRYVFKVESADFSSRTS